MILISKTKLPTHAKKYLCKHRQVWSRHWSYEVNRQLCHFHVWLDKNKIPVQKLTQRSFDRFIREDTARGPSKAPNLIIMIRGYVYWLKEEEGFPFHLERIFPDYYERWDRTIPPLAKKYYNANCHRWTHQASKTRACFSINRLHRWLRREGVSLRQLRRTHLEAFLADFNRRNPCKGSTLHTFLVHVRLYLDWLIDHHHVVEIDLSGIFPRGQDKTERKLDDHAREFLAIIPAIKKRKTCSLYKYVLCNFHYFLHERGLRMAQVQRHHLEEWFCALKDSGLAPSTRRHLLLIMRTYLYWLKERKYFENDPEHLIRIGDLPKRPKLLPRPLPPDIDFEIQRRLENSESEFYRGLLLLRKTGIRISELCNMPFDCVREDHMGNWALKVPLGKMENERLVPLDAKTLDLIRKIQKHTRETVGIDAGGLLPEMLFQYSVSSVTLYCWLRDSLKEVCHGIETPEPITPHRLRHTFATSLLSGGMSLYGVMRLLGHRSVTTTLIYAAVVQETIRDDYFEALDRFQTKYVIPKMDNSFVEGGGSPVQCLADAIRWLQKTPQAQSSSVKHRQAVLLIKRIQRLKSELEELASP